MRFYSKTAEYTVISTVSGDDRRFYAQDYRGRPRMLVVRQVNTETKRLSPIMLEWRENASFTDFVEFFPDGDRLVAAFSLRPGGIWAEGVQESIPYPQRAAMLRSLFGHIVSQDLPELALEEMLKPQNLRFNSSGVFCPHYDLPQSASCAKASLADAVRLICGEAAIPEVKGFIDALKCGSLANYAEMYTGACAAAHALESYSSPQADEGLTLELLKKRALALKPWIVERGAIALAAAALLTGYIAVGVFFYGTVIKPPRADNGISSIGTVVVGDG